MKLIIALPTLLVLTFFHTASFAQSTKCDVELSSSPAIRGFKLGMTKDEAEQAFWQSINRYTLNDKDDTASMAVAEFEHPEKLNGVIGIDMKLFDGKIYQMDITYGSGSFDNHAQAQQVFNQTWKLPNAWSPVKYGSSIMYCKG